MQLDYKCADQVLELSFGRLNRASARIDFPKPGALSGQLKGVLDSGIDPAVLSHDHSSLLASAGVEMWHRAIHSFLWSVALTETSPLWSAVCGYYSSHFVMRAHAHSMGIFKSFTNREVVQVKAANGAFVCQKLTWSNNGSGEHAFYWKAVKNHPRYVNDDLFRENSERNSRSESSHRTFANYTDHLSSFPPMEFPAQSKVVSDIEQISRIRAHSIEPPGREDYPDLRNVQILAYQRIVAFQDFLDEKVAGNRFWKAHRRPRWCEKLMTFYVEPANLEGLA